MKANASKHMAMSWRRLRREAREILAEVGRVDE